LSGRVRRAREMEGGMVTYGKEHIKGKKKDIQSKE
jgi:hypothetical protein